MSNLDSLIRNLECFFPDEYLEAFDFREGVLPHELLYSLPDGSLSLYDDRYKGCRLVFANKNDITEYEQNLLFRMRVRDIMSYKGITQKDLAKALGISQPAVNVYLTGKRLPSTYMIGKIAKILNCPIDDLIVY